MQNLSCPICKSKNLFLIWNDKIRNGVSKSTNKSKKIYRCEKCDTSFLKKRYESLPDETILRKIKDKKKINQILSFQSKRQLPKLKKIMKIYSYDKKKVLLVNCDFGLKILDILKKKTSLTAGVPESENSIFIKDYLEKNGHKFFRNLEEVKKRNFKFDVIISPAQIEHIYDPNKYLLNLKKLITKNGVIILRVPNHDNIYKHVLDKDYLKDDYRISHNFYFSKRSCEFIFSKNKFRIIKKYGLMEHDFNNLLNYIKLKKRPMQHDIKRKNKYLLYLSKKDNDTFTKHIENSQISTHFIYLIKPC